MVDDDETEGMSRVGPLLARIMKRQADRRGIEPEREDEDDSVKSPKRDGAPAKDQN